MYVRKGVAESCKIVSRMCVCNSIADSCRVVCRMYERKTVADSCKMVSRMYVRKDEADSILFTVTDLKSLSFINATLLSYIKLISFDVISLTACARGFMHNYHTLPKEGIV